MELITVTKDTMLWYFIAGFLFGLAIGLIPLILDFVNRRRAAKTEQEANNTETEKFEDYTILKVIYNVENSSFSIFCEKDGEIVVKECHISYIVIKTNIHTDDKSFLTVNGHWNGSNELRIHSLDEIIIH